MLCSVASDLGLHCANFSFGGLHSKMGYYMQKLLEVRVVNYVDQDQMPHSAASDWVYTVCLGLSV